VDVSARSEPSVASWGIKTSAVLRNDAFDGFRLP
jgi:hypothetical protein